MKVITVTGGRENKCFYENLEKFDDAEYDLINICTTGSGRFIAFLKHKNPGKEQQATKKIEVKGTK